MITTTPAASETGEGGSRPEASLHPYGHILVALDGSALAERVLPYVEPLVKTFGSQLTCLCAVEPISPIALAETGMTGNYVAMEPFLETRKEIEAEDARYIEHLKGRLCQHGIEAHCEEPEGRAAEAIVEAARTHGVDLIAMTTHGRSGLGRAILGSVADEVVRTAPCPVLLVRLTSEN